MSNLVKNKIKRPDIFLDLEVKYKNLDTNILDKKVFNGKIGQTKHYPPATQEWFNSIYLYNKNSIKLIPVKDSTLNNLLKSYFNLNPLYSSHLLRGNNGEIIKSKTKSFRSRPIGIRS